MPSGRRRSKIAPTERERESEKNRAALWSEAVASVALCCGMAGMFVMFVEALHSIVCMELRAA